MTTSLPSRLLIWTLGISEVFGTEIKIFFLCVLNGGGNLFAYLRMKKGGIFLGALHTCFGFVFFFLEDSMLVT